jgi:hypothetical protein
MARSLIIFKRQLKYFIILYLLLIHFTACEDKLDIPDTGRKIVVNGLITTDSLLNLRISKSAYYNEPVFVENMYLKNAKAYFYENNSIIDSLNYVSPLPYMGKLFYANNYRSKRIFPISGREYTVIVKAPGYPDATSSAVVPNLVRIVKVDTSRILVGPDPYHPDLKNVLLLCNINFNDPAKEINYYMVSVSINNSRSFDSPHIRFYFQDPIVEEVLGNETDEPYAIAFTDKVINGKNYNLRINVYGGDLGMPFSDDRTYTDGKPDTTQHKKVVYFRLYSLTEDYYRYVQTLDKYKNNFGNPLTEPVMIHSNISGGYGIFGAAAVSSDSIVFHY